MAREGSDPSAKTESEEEKAEWAAEAVVESVSAPSDVKPQQESTANGDSQVVFDSSRRYLITVPSPHAPQELPPLPREQEVAQSEVFSPATTDRDQSPKAENITCVSMYFGEATHCPINIGPRSRLGASSAEAQRDFTHVSPFSAEFGKVKTQIKQAIREEEREEALLDCATELSGSNPRDRLFPEAGEARSIDDFFRLGSSYEWWNWLDYDRLYMLLDTCNCTGAQKILRRYSEHLSRCVQESLAALNASQPRDRQHWLEMKCNCDHLSLNINAVYNHKRFLMNRLQIPREAFTFCDYYKGCVTTIWKVHSPFQAEAIKQRILTFDGAKIQKTEHGTVTSAPCACDLTSVLFDLVRSNSLNVNRCSLEDLCAKSKQGETLLMAAVRRNNPTLIKALLDKDLPKDIKDFKDNEFKQTAVTLAACLNYCKCLQVLLSYGCHPALPDVTGRAPLHYACANDCAACVKQITQSDSELKHLHWTTKFLSAACVSDKVIQAIALAKKRRQHRIVAPTLFEVATSGNFARAVNVLEEGDDLDVKNEHGAGAVYVAACHGHLGVLKELEMRGSKVVCFTEDGNTILHGAALSGRTDVMEYVLQCMALEEAQATATREQPPASAPWDVNARNDKGESALEIAAVNGYTEVIELMVSRGASPCVPSSSGRLVSSQVEHAHVQRTLDVMMKRHADKLEIAIKKKHTLAEFRKSWQNPYDHNLRISHGYSMLMVSAEYGRNDVLQYLLDSLSQVFEDGSNVLTELQASKKCGQMDMWLPCGDDDGYAEGGDFADLTSMKQSSSLVMYLHKNVSDDGSTAAHRAAVANMHRNLATLLDRCPTLANAQDSSGNTPLHLAVLWNNAASIKVLMEPSRKTNYAIRNRREEFPDQVFQNAVGSRRRKMIELREKDLKQLVVKTREQFPETEPHYKQCVVPRSCSRGTLSPSYSDTEQATAWISRSRVPRTR